MISDKKGLEHLSLLLIANNVKHIVFSPGSRNAPLIATFPRYKEFTCYSIIDERSAGFFALGIAQKTGETVVLSCTSGSALLNYSPALAEAYYQKIPLLVISADRPENMIDRGDGQTIRQRNIYANYIKKSIQLSENPDSEEELIEYQTLTLEAIRATQFPDKGPAHINIPFTEPIYGQKPKDNPVLAQFEAVEESANILESEFELLAKTWNSSSKKMIIIGQQKPNKQLKAVLTEISKDPSVIVLSETTSNISSAEFINCIDKTLATLPGEQQDNFLPDLLITFNSNIVSKKIKAFLRTEKKYNHWHIDEANEHLDTFFHLSLVVPINPLLFFEKMSLLAINNPSDYKSVWIDQKEKAKIKHQHFFRSVPYSDLTVFEQLLKNLPSNSNVHFANSTPVRYSQLFNLDSSLTVESNRGTSGIDGSISTAVGAAWVSNILTTIISGDLSFFYDSNALWNNYISTHLRIIVINNSGGGIFRFIEGPSQLPELEIFFETKHNRKAKSLAEEAGIEYQSADSLKSLDIALKTFFDKSKTAKLLEIFTPNELNAEVLKDYFKAMA
ncbi:MAG: 2-succinyl-5-enolpyruvyl-6-hydroxy-3-cyclohexene-1-carboxylic-acid synthase [Bacteroidales bacterium]|jgi:2-succinyl-5-enolpyruvyl-6-hydroxy-3-cyclohexene-1-carboxylate synthase|nr:2-succinyl-5-enolpyruvyl-6-hydroxy-3-cyclohexene-1-carboxylic-acid synthase [Bacteroidales bacterium]